jgi:hypothetical protein
MRHQAFAMAFYARGGVIAFTTAGKFMASAKDPAVMRPARE